MADIISPEDRSKNMAAIGNRDTGPELYIRKLLFSSGFRYRICVSQIPGHPDLWLKKYNTAIFVHGCFWHRHNNCKCATTPKTRTEFWQAKFERNMARDLEIRKILDNKGIRCLIIWECSIKSAQKKTGHPEMLLDRIKAFLLGTELYEEI